MHNRFLQRIERLRRLETERGQQEQRVKIVIVQGQHGIMDVLFLCDPTRYAHDEDLIGKLVQSVHATGNNEDDDAGPWSALVRILGEDAATARLALPASQPRIEGAL